MTINVNEESTLYVDNKEDDKIATISGTTTTSPTSSLSKPTSVTSKNQTRCAARRAAFMRNSSQESKPINSFEVTTTILPSTITTDVYFVNNNKTRRASRRRALEEDLLSIPLVAAILPILSIPVVSVDVLKENVTVDDITFNTTTPVLSSSPVKPIYAHVVTTNASGCVKNKSMSRTILPDSQISSSSTSHITTHLPIESSPSTTLTSSSTLSSSIENTDESVPINSKCILSLEFLELHPVLKNRSLDAINTAIQKRRIDYELKCEMIMERRILKALCNTSYRLKAERRDANREERLERTRVPMSYTRPVCWRGGCRRQLPCKNRLEKRRTTLALKSFSVVSTFLIFAMQVAPVTTPLVLPLLLCIYSSLSKSISLKRQSNACVLFLVLCAMYTSNRPTRISRSLSQIRPISSNRESDVCVLFLVLCAIESSRHYATRQYHSVILYLVMLAMNSSPRCTPTVCPLLVSTFIILSLTTSRIYSQCYNTCPWDERSYLLETSFFRGGGRNPLTEEQKKKKKEKKTASRKAAKSVQKDIKEKEGGKGEGGSGSGGSGDEQEAEFQAKRDEVMAKRRLSKQKRDDKKLEKARKSKMVVEENEKGNEVDEKESVDSDEEDVYQSIRDKDIEKERMKKEKRNKKNRESARARKAIQPNLMER